MSDTFMPRGSQGVTLQQDPVTKALLVSVPLSAIGKSYQIKSDKDTHFTTAIAVNAKEDENLAGLQANKILIVGVAVEAKEQNHYRALFWKTDGFDDTNLDLDSFIGAVDLDLVTNGFQIGGAGQWYWDEKLGRGNGIEYHDEDSSSELHVSLQNLGPGAKTAGVNGEVVLKVSYVPLE